MRIQIENKQQTSRAKLFIVSLFQRVEKERVLQKKWKWNQHMVCFVTFFSQVNSVPKIVLFQSTYIAYLKTYSVIWKCLIACITGSIMTASENGWVSQQLLSSIIQIKLTKWNDKCFILGQHSELDFNSPSKQSNRPQEGVSPYSETFCPPVTFFLLLSTTLLTKEGPWKMIALRWPSTSYKVSLYNKDVKFFHQTEHLKLWAPPKSGIQ